MHGEEELSLYVLVVGGVAAATSVRSLLVAEDIEARGRFEGAGYGPYGGINACREVGAGGNDFSTVCRGRQREASRLSESILGCRVDIDDGEKNGSLLFFLSTHTFALMPTQLARLLIES